MFLKLNNAIIQALCDSYSRLIIFFKANCVHFKNCSLSNKLFCIIWFLKLTASVNSFIYLMVFGVGAQRLNDFKSWCFAIIYINTSIFAHQMCTNTETTCAFHGTHTWILDPSEQMLRDKQRFDEFPFILFIWFTWSLTEKTETVLKHLIISTCSSQHQTLRISDVLRVTVSSFSTWMQ